LDGPGFGLDEIEAFKSEIAGITDGVSSGCLPLQLETIAFVENTAKRARRLEIELKELFPQGLIQPDSQGSVSGLKKETTDSLSRTGSKSSSKPRIFVAMPFANKMDDVFHYGIQGAVNSAGFLCERADLSTFTGDVLDWVKSRIAGSTIVVADLSSANPNVYLEVGYAWGSSVPTILLARESSDLKFDVRGQKCLLYNSIKTLEGILGKELHKLMKPE
jgi:hypothetical protein